MRPSLVQKVWRHLIPATSLLTALALGAVVLAQPPDRAATDQVSDANAIEYLTRGPLHEAFAEPYEADPSPAPLVTAEPPEPIDELPPEYRPAGDNVQWIPGYWAWDDERQDFLWVSGLWREVPPDHRWVPGYWVAVDSGYQWVSGFWAGAELAEIQYLPPPPESIESGPSAPAPAENHFYIPGHWVYQNGAYRWRPGFWSPLHENWVWVPAQYIWTPRGTVFRQGYWDYDIAYRGIVFTPVYYRQPVYRSEQFVYRPRYTIDTGLNLLVHMFVRPDVRQYYFGDYYGPRYAEVFQPWVVRYQQPTFYDPFYAHYRSRGVGQEANLLAWVTNQHQVFATSERIRPARTIADQQQLMQTVADTDLDPTILRLAAVGEAIENLADDPDANFRFQPLSEDEVVQIRDSTQPLRELVQMRQRIESEPVAADAAATAPDATDVAAAATEEPTATDEATSDPAAADPQNATNVGAPLGSLELPAVAQSPSDPEAQTEAARTDAAPAIGERVEETPRRTRDTSNDLPPGRQAVELTPEEQRDRRFDATSAVPDITGTQAGAIDLGADAAAAAEDPVQPGVTRPAVVPDETRDLPAESPVESPADAPRRSPAAADRQPAATAPRDAAAADTAPADSAPAPAPAADAATAPGAASSLTPLPLPGGDTRDPAAGQRMRGDVRMLPDARAGNTRRGSSADNSRERVERMRPARPEGWPPRGERTRALPTRPGAAIGLESGAVVPGGAPAIGGSAPGLNEAAIPRAGNLTPGGAPGVGRGAPNQTGTSRSREAQPHTLPDLTEEQGLQQRR